MYNINNNNTHTHAHTYRCPHQSNFKKPGTTGQWVPNIFENCSNFPYIESFSIAFYITASES